MDDGAVPTALNPLRRAANVGGTLLCVVAIVFLARRGYTLGVSIGDGFARIGAGAFAVAIACYAAAAAMLGVAWVALVRIAAGHRVAAAPLYTSHLRAQLAKYLPGNVFHVAYRHVAARRAGVGHAPLALALGMETLLIVASAGTFSLGVSSDARIVAIAPWAHALAWAAWALPVAGAVAVSLYARRAGRRIAMSNLLRGIAGVLAIYLAFIALSALALRSLAPGGGGLSIGGWCGWFALAWVLGYVMPGAPAGLGVRETVLVLGLGPALGDAQALVIALAYRLVTVVVDAALAGIGFVLRGRP